MALFSVNLDSSIKVDVQACGRGHRALEASLKPCCFRPARSLRIYREAQTLSPLAEIDFDVLPSPPLADALRRVFADFERLIGYLDLIRTDTESARETSESLLTTVYGEALVLVSFIEDYLLELPGLSGTLYETLDSSCFAIRYELGKTFQHEPPSSSADSAVASRRQTTEARDVLRNCFQQSMLMLGTLLSPGLSSDELFKNIQTRREQSLVLWEDLIELLQSVREAERECAQPAIAYLIELLKQFSAGSMHYLISDDWATFDSFLNRLMNCRTTAEVQPLLQQLDCYLEVLLSHVRMRAALVDVTAQASQ